eukprot:CAMPEP_0185157044 /NCGR_PEP_ID=MMETSP1139-20130426/1514_1 /TAXON_ID=298111 /ORGANISM="Pavlova sp., Strain CCMP459" /LENGTH=384 /DNA_ID=CAMNT_0027722093 /DNA_START=1 /DNA_END=1155 /DNA_ORIENTATION=+
MQTMGTIRQRVAALQATAPSLPGQADVGVQPASQLGPAGGRASRQLSALRMRLHTMLEQQRLQAHWQDQQHAACAPLQACHNVHPMPSAGLGAHPQPRPWVSKEPATATASLGGGAPEEINKHLRGKAMPQHLASDALPFTPPVPAAASGALRSAAACGACAGATGAMLECGAALATQMGAYPPAPLPQSYRGALSARLKSNPGLRRDATAAVAQCLHNLFEGNCASLGLAGELDTRRADAAHSEGHALGHATSLLHQPSGARLRARQAAQQSAQAGFAWPNAATQLACPPSCAINSPLAHDAIPNGIFAASLGHGEHPMHCARAMPQAHTLPLGLCNPGPSQAPRDAALLLDVNEMFTVEDAHNVLNMDGDQIAIMEKLQSTS